MNGLVLGFQFERPHWSEKTTAKKTIQLQSSPFALLNCEVTIAHQPWAATPTGQLEQDRHSRQRVSCRRMRPIDPHEL